MSKTKKPAQDMMIGLASLGIGCVYYALSEPKPNIYDAVDENIYERLLAVLLGLLGLISLARGVLAQVLLARREAPHAAAPAGREGVFFSLGARRTLAVIGIAVIYIYALNFIGFLLLSPLAAAALLFTLGERRARVLALLPVGVTAALYGLFAVIIGVLLPLGLLEYVV